MNELTFHVAGLLKAEVGATRTHEIQTDALRLDEQLEARDVNGAVRLLRTKKGVLAQGRVEARVELSCSRCLEPVDTVVQTSFEDEYRPSVDVNTGKPVSSLEEGEEAEDYYSITPNHLVDLSESIRQAIVLDLPFSPLCTPDCAGICPSCGAELNVQTCDCARTVPDHRLAGLAALMDKVDA